MSVTSEDYNLKTAGFNCFCRAIAEASMGERPTSDKVSQIFLPRMARYVIRLGIWRSLFQKFFGPPGTFSFVVSRTLAIDRVYEQALQKGIDQVVILGAGFDTRAFRINGPKAVSVFELDLAKTQQLKRRKLERSHVSIPANLHFVPCDFQSDPMEACLAGHGYDFGKPALFIMEGLTMYLTRQAVVDMLRFIETKAAPGSEAVFDVMHSSLFRGKAEGYGAESMINILKEHQSPFHFVADPEEVQTLAAEIGLEIKKIFSGKDMTDILAQTSKPLEGSVAEYLTLYHVAV